jgi:hypothetical protein
MVLLFLELTLRWREASFLAFHFSCRATRQPRSVRIAMIACMIRVTRQLSGTGRGSYVVQILMV